MFRRACPLLVLLLAAGCGDDGPTDPAAPPLPTITTESWDYLDNRFFRLDLAVIDLNGDGQHDNLFGYARPDLPGRAGDEFIDLESTRIYRFVGSGSVQPADVMYVAVSVDTTGRWVDLPPAGEAWTNGLVWRPVPFTPYLSTTGVYLGIDLGREMAPTDLLAVVYKVVDGNGNLRYQVGDDPHHDLPGLIINGQPHFRMKLLKSWLNDAFAFQYVLRNIYSLGAENIQACDFNLVIERNTDETHPSVEQNGLSYLRIFGLDRHGPDGTGAPDGIVDENDPQLFDLARGLLRFPLHFPTPFAAPAATYAANAGVSLTDFAWDDTYLSSALTPEIYAATTLPSTYPAYAPFRLVATVGPG